MVLTHYERLQRSLSGRDIDRLPVSVWRHFPGADAAPESLIRATVDFQRAFDSDFVKLMPSGMYSVADYGVQITAGDPSTGNMVLGRSPIRRVADWRRLPHPDGNAGSWADALALIRGVREEIPADTPVIMTLFSPLTMVVKIAGERQQRMLLDDPSAAAGVLERLSQDVIAFAHSATAAGVDGFYYATQEATTSSSGAIDRYRTYGTPYDRAVLGAIRDECAFLIVHVHGKHPLLDIADELPVDCVSWDDRDSDIDIADGASATGRAVCGGLDRAGTLLHGTPGECSDDVRSLLRSMPSTKAVVAPGCVLLQGTKEANIAATVAAVRAGTADLQRATE